MRNGDQGTIRQPERFEGNAAVVFAMLGAPAAWAGHLSVNYFLVQPVCRLGGNSLFHVSGVVFLLIAIGAGLVALWLYRRSRGDAADSVEGNASISGFVAMFGIASAGIFSLAIISQWYPVFVVGPCVGLV